MGRAYSNTKSVSHVTSAFFPCSRATFGSGPRPQRRAAAGLALLVSRTRRTTCGLAQVVPSCPRRRQSSQTGTFGAILRYQCLTVHSHCPAHSLARLSSDPGYACSPDYNDSAWRLVDVPHDFIVEGNFTPDADRGHGYLPFNISWYRKHFTVDAAAAVGLVSLEFDGVYRASTYWL